MKELTKTYSSLLQDRRVKSEQAQYESFTKQRSIVLGRYRKVSQAFNDLIDGLVHAQSFYSEMKETVVSLEKNVENFVSNRRSEGAQLLGHIEHDRQTSAGSQADRERDRLRDLMERMSTEPSGNPGSAQPQTGRPSEGSSSTPSSDLYNSRPQPVLSASNSKNVLSNSNAFPTRSLDPSHQGYQPSHHDQPSRGSHHSGGSTNPPGEPQYNPMMYPYQTTKSPPINQTYQQIPQYLQPQKPHPLPQGYVPPPPPPGPPPKSQGNYGFMANPHPSGPGGYAYHQPRAGGKVPQQQNSDPWAGLDAWK